MKLILTLTGPPECGKTYFIERIRTVLKVAGFVEVQKIDGRFPDFNVEILEAVKADHKFPRKKSGGATKKGK